MSGAPGARRAATNIEALLDIAKQNALPLVGLNWKDEDDAALGTGSSELGNPYIGGGGGSRRAHGHRLRCRMARRKPFSSTLHGVVQYRHVGAMTAEVWQREFLSRLPREACHEERRMRAVVRSASGARVAGRIARVGCLRHRMPMPTPEMQKRYDGAGSRTALHAVPEPEHRRLSRGPGGRSAPRRAEQIIAGKTDAEIRDSMVARYGNVILFRPPFKPSTAWVWIAPFLLLLVGVFVAVRIVRQRALDGGERRQRRRYG